MPLALLLDQAHPMSMLPELAKHANTLPDAAVDELRSLNDVHVRLLYLFPENVDLSGLCSTANGLGQLIDLTSLESAHLLNEARRVIHKVYIDELGWQFGENTPSNIQRVKAPSVCGSLPPTTMKNRARKYSGSSLNLPTCIEESSRESSPRQSTDFGCQTLPFPIQEIEEKTTVPSPFASPFASPLVSPLPSRRNSISSSTPTQTAITVPVRRPSFLNNSQVVMDGVADKFDEHAVWCLALVDDERFDTKRNRVCSSRRQLPNATIHGNLVILTSRVVGCVRILARENCPNKTLEMEGYLSEHRNQALLRRLQEMGNSADPLQRVEFQRLVEMNRLAILKEYRGISLSDDLTGMACVYAFERGSSIITSTPYKAIVAKTSCFGGVEMGELMYEDHDPTPCNVFVIKLPALQYVNRVVRSLLFMVPRKYWRPVYNCVSRPQRLLVPLLIILLFVFIISAFLSL